MTNTALLNPTNANPLEMGEWVMLTAGALTVVRSDGSLPSWVNFTEKGRSDTQALGKITTLFLGGYEAETLIYTFAGLATGTALKCDAGLTYGGIANRSGLIAHAGGVDLIIGYVMQVTAATSYMRFIQTAT